jgi:hypothetical protein
MHRIVVLELNLSTFHECLREAQPSRFLVGFESVVTWIYSYTFHRERRTRLWACIAHGWFRLYTYVLQLRHREAKACSPAFVFM